MLSHMSSFIPLPGLLSFALSSHMRISSKLPPAFSAPSHTCMLFRRHLQGANRASMSFDGKGMKKVAIFDATDTLMELSEPVGDTYWKLAAKHSLSPSGGADGLMLRFKEEYQKMKPIDYPSIGPGHAQKAEISWWRELVRKVFASEDSPAFEACFQECYDHFGKGSAWKLFPEAENTLLSLREEGWKVGILSNFDMRLRQVLNDRCAKPNKAIFEKAVQASGVAAGMDDGSAVFLYVGDSVIFDVQGAAHAGMHSVLVDRRGKWKEGPPPVENCTVVADLKGVLDLARSLGER